MSNWFILDRNGEPLPQDQLPERPDDARSDAGDRFTPWYKEDGHLHVEEGKIRGIHAQAESLEEARTRLVYFLEHEELLLSVFGGMDDILISEAEEAIKKDIS